ncbi:lysophospholipid acyltransferase family protein [Mycoplasmatota bacterium WC30]
MLAIIHIILSILFTTLYSIHISISLDFLGILSLLLIFVIANIIAIIAILLTFVIFIYFTEKIDPRKVWKHKVYNLYSMYMFRFLYRVRLITTGKENLPKNRNFVLYANHIEYTDPMFIMHEYYRYGVGFIAKDPLYRFIVLRNLFNGMGCLPITRFADRSALETILKAIKQVKNGQPMGIFPEAKRTYSNDLIELKPGAFKVAQKAKADISPVCLYNMHILNKKYRILPKTVYMHILPVIKYEDYKDLSSVDLSKMVYKLLNNQMEIYKNS